MHNGFIIIRQFETQRLIGQPRNSPKVGSPSASLITHQNKRVQKVFTAHSLTIWILFLTKIQRFVHRLLLTSIYVSQVVITWEEILVYVGKSYKRSLVSVVL